MKSSLFRKTLRKSKSAVKPSRWLYIPYDQLNTRFIEGVDASGDVGVIFIESQWKGRQRPYHKQKLVFILANMRHFALSLVERGIPIHYVFSDQPYETVLLELIENHQWEISVHEPAEYELRQALVNLAHHDFFTIRPHPGWLSTANDFKEASGGKWPVKMDRFYRFMRQKTGILMEEGKPVGGKYSFDVDNRLKWKGDPAIPEVPKFKPDAITREVIEMVDDVFAHHPGQVNPDVLVVGRDQALQLWRWCFKECLHHFGPYQDAMTLHSSSLFHSRISGLLHLHLLLPKEVVRDVETMALPIASKEGFIRQVLGWREYMFHVHRTTEGLRQLPIEIPHKPTNRTRDGGYWKWSGQKEPDSSTAIGPAPNYLGVNEDLFPVYWGTQSGMACMDACVRSVWDEAYGHHISRLMVLANFATLMDVHPRQVTDWFWVAYHDAFDWVVEPNVLGMGVFALGTMMTTKPYVAGSSYINKMSDFCGGCAFDPKTNCPFKRLYWQFFERHSEKLQHIQRLRMPLVQIKKRSAEEKSKDADVFALVQRRLNKGESLSPQDFK